MRSSLTRSWLILVLGTASSFGAQGPASANVSAITTLSRLAALDGDEAARGLPVKLKGVVTYFDHDRGLMFIQDGQDTASVRLPTPREGEDVFLQAGQIVELEGTTARGRLKPSIRARLCRAINQGPMPKPFDLIPGKLSNQTIEGRLVQLKGWIPNLTATGSRLTFSVVLGPGQSLDVIVNGSDSPKAKELPGALAELIGVFTFKFDSAGQINGGRVYVNDLEAVGKLKSLRITPVADVGSIADAAAAEPVRVRGTVVNHSLGQFVLLRDSSGSIRIPYPGLNYFNAGSLVEAFAFPLQQRPTPVFTNVVLKLVPADTSSEEAAPAIITPQAPNTNLATLFHIAQIRRLSPQEASRGYPIDITGVITFFDLPSYLHFIQDDTSGIYFDISRVDNLSLLRAGQRIRLQGFSGPGDFAPIIIAQTAQILGGTDFPAPESVSFRKLMSGTFDSQWVSLKGVVRNEWFSTNASSIALFVGDGLVKVGLPPATPQWRATNLIDASVEIYGICRTLFDEHRRLQGVELQAPDWAQLTVREAPTVDPFTLPVKAVNELFQFHAGAGEIHRVRLMGVVTLRSSDGSFYLQDGSGGIQVQPGQPISGLAVGTLVDVAGFPTIIDKLAMLQEAMGRTERDQATIEPADLKPDMPLEDALQASLIRIQGQILGRFSHGSEELLTVRFGQRMIDVILEKDSEQDRLTELQPGTVARLTGVCLAQSDTAGTIQSFRLLLRAPEDIAVLSRPSWWTAERTLRALAGVATILLLALGWVRALHRQVHQRTEQLHEEIELHKRTEARLEAEIAERKRMQSEVERTHQELLVASRQAGMAEVATSVLHNVGNVLNSVNVSAGVIAEKIRNSKLNNFGRASELLKAHAHDLAHFLEHDLKGRQLPQYLGRLADHLNTEQKATLSELDSLRKNVEHIKGIVGVQQNYAKVFGATESVKPTDLVEDALRMNSGALVRHEVRVIREYAPDLPQVTVDKHKMLQILVNLICNAKKACDESIFAERRLTVRVHTDEGSLQISVIDNGIGIPRENLTRIFNHGFTTRKDGHGFGLHSGALAAKEMGGTLLAHSEGVGKGARFTLTLPLKPA
ncbi:MAG TPA: ATP-binding protein [Verrucomicrobiae bacterium]|nr:ATP-binding protein [Verrucomicrobiae bacterium]